MKMSLKDNYYCVKVYYCGFLGIIHFNYVGTCEIGNYIDIIIR